MINTEISNDVNPGTFRSPNKQQDAQLAPGLFHSGALRIFFQKTLFSCFRQQFLQLLPFFEFIISFSKPTKKRILRKCYFSVRIIQQVCHLFPFFAQLLSVFLEILLLQSHSTVDMLLLGDEKQFEDRKCTIINFRAIGE